MRWVVSSAVVLVFLMFLEVVSAQQAKEPFIFDDTDAKSKAKSDLEFLVSDLDFGVRDCYCDWKITFESSPGSSRLFSSKGKLKFLNAFDDALWTSSEWQTDVFFDDRQKTESNVSLFGDCDFEQLMVDGKYYDNKSKTFAADFNNSRYKLGACPILNPLNVPFLHSACLRTVNSCGGAKAFFAGPPKCVGTRSSGSLLESLWIDKDNTGKSFAYTSVKCKDGLPQRFEVVVVPGGFVFADGLPAQTECKSVALVESKWSSFEGTSVPVSCEGMLSPAAGLFGVETLHFDAKMTYYGKTSKPFVEKESELRPIIDAIRSKKTKIP